MIIRKKTKEIQKKYVDRKLIFRLRRFAVVLVVLGGVLAYDMIYVNVNPLFVIGGIIVGFSVGAFVGQYANVHWHEEAGKVISKMDRTGVIVLVLYLSFSLSRRWVLAHWIHGSTLSATSFSIAAGVMTGRLITIRKQIREILRGKGILPPKVK